MILGFLFLLSETVIVNDGSFAREQKSTLSLGRSLHEISWHLIDRLEKYYLENKRYANHSGQLRFEDIGLDWQYWEGKAFGGIIYDPQGDALEIRPAEGYTFFVDEPNGNTRILSYDLHWSLIYSLKDKKWYFYEISPEEIVDIRTLKVKKDTPYNPQEYKK